MKTIWVVLLSVLALLLGSCGGLVWRGASTAFEGLRIACAVASTAESAGLMSKAQVAEAVDRMFARMDKDASQTNREQFAKELKTGCPSLAKLGGK